MKQESAGPFDSIESAYDFLVLLSEVVVDAKQNIGADLEAQPFTRHPRAWDATQLAIYNLEKLELHLGKSIRILNDLRSLRRLMFAERIGSAEKPLPLPKVPKTVTPMPATATSRPAARAKTAAAA